MHFCLAHHTLLSVSANGDCFYEALACAHELRLFTANECSVPNLRRQVSALLQAKHVEGLTLSVWDGSGQGVVAAAVTAKDVTDAATHGVFADEKSTAATADILEVRAFFCSFVVLFPNITMNTID